MPLEVRPGGQGTTLFRCYCGVVCLFLVAFLVAQRLSDGANPQESVDGIPPDIVARVESICRQLVPCTGEVEITAFGQGDPSSGPRRASWTVACNAADRSLNFIFERPSGSLLLCSQMGRRAKQGEVALKDAKTAESMGHRYLHVLGLEGKDNLWLMSGVPVERENSWLLRFHQGKRRLYMSLCSWTRDLLLLKQDKPIPGP